MIFSPHSYQRQAVNFLLERSYGALFADPGLGKTPVTLTVIKALTMAEAVPRWLVIAPLRVAANTWPDEIAKWDQFRGLRYQVCHGKTKQIDLSNQIFLVNPEGLAKFLEQPEAKQITGLVIDESTKFKNWSAKRVKLLKKNLGQFDRRFALTGTPTPNGYLDLFAQVHLLDGGEHFGRSIVRYKERYFRATDYQRYNWVLKSGAAEKIEEKIAPFVLRLDGDELLNLPSLVPQNIFVNLPAKVSKAYSEVQKDLFSKLDELTLSAASKVTSYGLCRQLASGAVITEEGVEQIHTEKIDAVKDFYAELQKPLLIAYNYIHEKDRLLKAFGGEIDWVGGGVSPQASKTKIDKWLSGEVPILAAQAASISHGLNLQYGGCRHIVWFSLTDNLETYQQFNRRIRRQGVDSTVFVHHIVARDTIDEALLLLIAQKEKSQKGLLDALNEYRKGQGE